jgi:hypothetical protein
LQEKTPKRSTRIAREKDIVRFMKDWSENARQPEDYYDYIDWLQSKKDSTDIYENKRYAVAKKDTDELIGMVGMGLEDTLNEVEVAYFMSAALPAQRLYRTGGRGAYGMVLQCFRRSLSDTDGRLRQRAFLPARREMRIRAV